jgi:acyl-CoA synthetase (AMP-forming)/AMP-acid ligase II
MDPRSCSLPELIRWSTNTFAELDAVRDGETTLSYSALGERIDQAARAMVASGVRQGDAVAVWAPNCWQWIVAGMATIRAGAVLVPVNTRFKGNEAAYVLGRARARLLFVVDGFLDTDYSGSLEQQDLPHLDEIVDLVSSSDGRTTAFEAFVTRGDGSDRSELQAAIDRCSQTATADDVSAIMFTSGTTGHPKGVLVRGGAIIRVFAGWSEALTVRAGDRYLLVNPYFHAFGFNAGIVVCLLKGAVNLPVAVYDPVEVLAIIERENVTVFPGPPAMFQGLLNHRDLDRYDISSLRACVTGAATIPVEMIVAMRENLGFEVVMTAYGMTETSGIASYTRPTDPPELVATTSGCAPEGVELRIVDAEGNDVSTGEEGELLVRGFQVMPGYLDAPDQTADVIDLDGWLHTGDIAVMDQAGYIDITDRKKDMFIMGGFNAYPAEIERVMVGHPRVGIVAVIGVPDERMGEVAAAFVVPSPEGVPDAAELIEWCREQMANYKVPRHIWLVDELPLNASNKVRKQELRADAAVRLSTKHSS